MNDCKLWQFRHLENDYHTTNFDSTFFDLFPNDLVASINWNTVHLHSVVFFWTFQNNLAHQMTNLTEHKSYRQQGWSRGHKARGQGQGHKKNPRPRPRTAFPMTDPLEAKDSNARGQGPTTQKQVFSKKKKTSSKEFFRQSPIYRRSQNFWLGRPKPQITCNDVIKNLPVGT